jgi:hypothetical protein
MVFMKKSLLVTSLLLITFCINAQKDTIYTPKNLASKSFLRESASVNISIYPVPVRYNSFSIKTDREMKLVKVTNMIGQDIFRAQYKNPLSFTRVLLENPRRGMYLVTIAFTDGSRVVKKIMVENPD